MSENSKEELIKESERQYRESIDKTGAGYFYIDGEGCFRKINQAWLNMHKYGSPDEIIGKHFSITQTDTDMTSAQNIMEKLLKGQNIASGEFSRKCKDGSVGYHIFSARTVYKDGEIIGVEGFLLDITDLKESSRNLTESEERYRLLVETSPRAIMIHQKGIFVYVNPATVQLFRASDKDELLGKRFIDRVAEKYQGMVTERIKIMEHEQLSAPKIVEQFVRIDGTLVDVEVVSTRTSYRSEPAFQIIAQDITERKKAEDILHNYSVYSRTLIETSLDPLVTISAEGKITDVNTATEKITGMSRENLIGSDFSDYFTEPEMARAGYQTVFKQGQVINYPLSIRHKNGNVTEVLYNASVYKDEKGDIVGVFAAARDITDRKKAEEALRTSEVRYRKAQAMGHVGNWEYNLQTSHFWGSDEAKRIYGFDPEQADFSIDEVESCIPERERVHKALVDLIDIGKAYNLEFEILPRNSSEPRVIASIAELQRDEHGEPLKVVGVIQDITEHKKLEKEMLKIQKLESVGMLAGGIAHDFNNILTGIVGNISMVRHALDPADKNFEILNEAEKAVFQAKDLTRQLLTFAKGGLPVKKVVLLSDIVKEAAVFATRGTNVRCKFDIAPKVHFVYVDPGQISQVISNIVINAVQSMPEGGEVCVIVENIDLKEGSNIPLKVGEYKRIIIKDTGCGIAPQNLTKIFDPYFTTKQTGNGLGLATCYSIIKNHDGYINAESELGKSTSLSIYIPAFVGKVHNIPVADNKKIKKGSGHILVMDDEPMICMVAKRILAGLGYTTESVTDGDQVVLQYKKAFGTPEAFDVVILDLTVPGGKGGKETIEELKKIDPGIKAVVSSGYSNDPIMANYEFYGFSGVLQKPYRIEEMSEICYKLLHS